MDHQTHNHQNFDEQQFLAQKERQDHKRKVEFVKAEQEQLSAVRDDLLKELESIKAMKAELVGLVSKLQMSRLIDENRQQLTESQQLTWRHQPENNAQKATKILHKSWSGQKEQTHVPKIFVITIGILLLGVIFHALNTCEEISAQDNFSPKQTKMKETQTSTTRTKEKTRESFFLHLSLVEKLSSFTLTQEHPHK